MSTDRNLPQVSEEIRELCHYRHMWDRVDSNHWTATRGDPLTLRCMRCDAEFRAQISPSGVYVTKRYVYAPGYLYGKTDYRFSHAERRALIIRQSIFTARKNRVAHEREHATT